METGVAGTEPGEEASAITADSSGEAPAGEAMPSEPAESSAGVPLQAGVAKLTPENTKIGFIGTHAGDDPNPRVGEFEKFSGELRAGSDGTLESITAEIEAASLKTPIDKLSNHLRNEDFLDVREYPTIGFKSTKISKQDDGTHTVTGDLTLHGTTKSVEFPATVTGGSSAVGLSAEFTIDRTEFGMDRLTDNVEKEVRITVAVGEQAKSEQTASAAVDAAGGESDG